MRTDAKIGFAIGGVLLLVLVIYAIAVPKHPKQTAANKPNTVVIAPRDADPAPVSIGPDTVAPATFTQQPLIGTTPVPPVDVTPPAAQPKPPAGGTAFAGRDATHDGMFRAGGSGDVGHDPMAVGGTSVPLIDTAPVSPHVDAPHLDAPRHPGHAAPVVAAGNPNQYTIRPNDTLSSIAAEVYGNAKYWTRIADANKDVNPNRLKVGGTLSLPAVNTVHGADAGVTLASAEVAADPAVSDRSYRVQGGDSLYRISKKLYGTSHRADEIYHLNEKLIGPDEAKLKTGTVLRLPEPATAGGHMATVAQ